MRKPEPYFMKNPEWYYHDAEKMRYFLTDKAPREAIESYNEFYADEYVDPVFLHNVIQDAEQSYREDLKREGKTSEEIEKIISTWLHNITTHEN